MSRKKLGFPIFFVSSRISGSAYQFIVVIWYGIFFILAFLLGSNLARLGCKVNALDRL
jgi:hypothetical protein